jgi:ABC-type iron transport system FetAB ATPase subunit
MLTLRALKCRNLAPFGFELGAGESVALRGPSGAGKTILLRAIADLDPCAGEVLLDGEERNSMPAPAWRQRVTYLAAESGWWADRVGDHFEDRDAVLQWLPAMKLPEDALDWPVPRLSTGERQRLAFARVLVRSPRVMLLDEPTSGLDRDATAAVEEILTERLAAGVAIIFVTHDPAQAKRLARRGLEIADGAVREVAP